MQIPMHFCCRQLFSHGVGIIVNKRVGGRILAKRINVRVEHIQPSQCREDFLKRVKKNDELKRLAKETGKRVNAKREPVLPRKAHFVRSKKAETEIVAPVQWVEIA